MQLRRDGARSGMLGSDPAILAALLGVGVVVSPLVVVRADGAASPAGEVVVGSALRVGIVAELAEARGARAWTPAGDAARDADADAGAGGADADASGGGARPMVIEALDGPLARLGVVADRGFAVVLEGGSDRAIGRRVEGPLALDGRPLLVHVAASWCTPCAGDLPTFLGLAAEAPRAVMIAAEDVVGPAGVGNVLEALAARAEPSSRELPVGLELRADPTWAWAAWLGRQTLPLTAVIDRDGALTLLVEGALDEDAAARVRQHLDGGRP